MPTNDNWESRSKNMSCATCMAYVPKNDTKGKPTEVGRCRNHSPSPGPTRGWPVVFNSDWCLDHKLDENHV
jgi:hypothetical protein